MEITQTVTVGKKEVEVVIDLDEHLERMLESTFRMTENEIWYELEKADILSNEQEKQMIIAECADIKLPPHLHDFLCAVFGRIQIGL